MLSSLYEPPAHTDTPDLAILCLATLSSPLSAYASDLARNSKPAAASISFKCMSSNGAKTGGATSNGANPTSPNPNGTALRPATEHDIEAIRSIYNHEVENGTSTFDLRPRTSKEQKLWFDAHVGAYAAIVATEAGMTELAATKTTTAASELTVPPNSPGTQVAGFGSLSPYRERPAYRGTAEVSVYVHHAHKRKGIGQALLNELVEKAQQHGFHTLIARVSGPNDASHALFKASGFEKVGVEKEVGRKFNQWLDCAIYQRMLKSSNPQ